ncbi:MAG TPA: CSLREA domain-containing protein, partial [Anaerolineales bacterium]|nr:CSLREA domain-containing protein [Anaerolineales bacterium]
MLKKKTFWLACARAAAPALFFVLLLHLAFPNPLAVSAAGATIEVTSVVDVLADDGDCTLREAIQAANLDEAVGGCPAGAGADTIVLPAGVYTLSRAGTYEDANQTGDLDILAGLTILGAGQDITTVDGGQIDRVFHILLPGTRVQMEALSITGGAAPEEDELGGGGVLSWGNLTLTAMKFTANSGARGGGARNSEGYLLVNDSLFTQNDAFFEGGGLYSDGEMTVHNTLVTANTSPRGAGVSSDNRLYMTDVTLSANIAENGDGGGLYNDFDAWLDRVTFLDNQALHGGGIYNNQVLWLTNITFSGN